MWSQQLFFIEKCNAYFTPFTNTIEIGDCFKLIVVIYPPQVWFFVMSAASPALPYRHSLEGIFWKHFAASLDILCYSGHSSSLTVNPCSLNDFSPWFFIEYTIKLLLYIRGWVQLSMNSNRHECYLDIPAFFSPSLSLAINNPLSIVSNVATIHTWYLPCHENSHACSMRQSMIFPLSRKQWRLVYVIKRMRDVACPQFDNAAIEVLEEPFY